MIKLAFTTLGCPKWEMNTIISKAVEYNFDAIDFRGYLGQMDIYNLPEFTVKKDQLKNKFKDANLGISCFSSSVKVFTKDKKEHENNIREIIAYSKLCNFFNAKYIRIFGGCIGKTNRNEAIKTAIINLKELSLVAKQYNIILAWETHDDWLDSEIIRKVIDSVNTNNIGVLWDTHHPYRLIDESPEKTWEVLKKYILYTHWKDSYIDKNSKYKLCNIGDGDIPLREIYNILIDGGYNGYFTLEWEKVWHPEIDEPEIAFPNFINYMRKLENTHE